MIYDATSNTLGLTDVTINWKTTTPPTTADIEGLDDTLGHLGKSVDTLNSCLILDSKTGNLTLGRELNNTLTDNVLIGVIEDKNGVYIRDGETILTSFQKDKICLGNNTEASSIELCGGIGTISVYVDPDGFSEGLYMDSSRLAFESTYEHNRVNTSGFIGIDPQSYSELETPGSNVKIQSDYSDGDGNVGHAAINVNANSAGSSIGISTLDYSISLDSRGFITEAPITLSSSSSISAYDPNETSYELLRLGGNESIPICIVGDGIYGHSTGYTNVCGGIGVYLKTTTTNGVAYTQADDAFRPLSNGLTSLGTSSHKWSIIYSANGTIQTSDKREKENIKPLDTSDLFDRLKPVQYNFINGDGKTSYGLIAQDVVVAMEEIGLSEDELSLVYHDQWIDKETGADRDVYGLAYNNLIAMLIHEVQKLKVQNNNLETRLSTFESL